MLTENESKCLAVAAELLNRVSSDPDFAKRFDSDPAAALQSFHPVFSKMPKEKIVKALKTDDPTAALPAAGTSGLASGVVFAAAASRLIFKTTKTLDEPEPE